MDHGESSYRRFLEGDQTAFDSIVSTYRPGLILFINRFVRNLETAEDIAIDVFVEVLIHPKRYHFQASLKTYLYMIGRSRALDALRRGKCLPTTELPGDLAAEEELEETVFRDQRKRALRSALAELPEQMQQAVYLVYFEDMGYAEAAAVMQKSRKQIDNLLCRAKAALRDKLGKEWEIL
ncbi:MAG: RNA polymerase sigma factor [Faecousia sp.]